jgi:DNA-3-methyladenine glycosylase II
MNPPEPLRYLRRRDPVLRPALRRARPLRRRRRVDLYRDLLEAIISQQLSVRAAATIFARFLALFPDGAPAPAALLQLTDDQLRAAGVSRQKAAYLKNAADFALHHDLSARTLRRMSDEAILAQLTAIKGVGRWTVEMLLMFSLGRPDVFPADDLGIQNAMKKLYGLRSRGPALRRRMAAIAEAWRPHRTYACVCLWRMGDER